MRPPGGRTARARIAARVSLVAARVSRIAARVSRIAARVSLIAVLVGLPALLMSAGSGCGEGETRVVSSILMRDDWVKGFLKFSLLRTSRADEIEFTFDVCDRDRTPTWVEVLETAARESVKPAPTLSN